MLIITLLDLLKTHLTKLCINRHSSYSWPLNNVGIRGVDSSHSGKSRCNLQSALFIPTYAGSVKAMVFPVVTDRCESWAIKKAECQKIDAFKRWCWKRLLKVPWTAGRSNQSILKEVNPEYSLEVLMLKLNLQYFDHLMQRANSLEKTVMLGKIEGRRRRG